MAATKPPKSSTPFRLKIDTVAKIMSGLEMVDRRNHWPNYVDMAKDIRKENYRDEWNFYETNSLFDIQLTDGSLFQFKEYPEPHTERSFCFYESPLAIDDYATFVHSRFELDAAQIGDLAREDYDTYIATAGLKKVVTMIRYDHSPGLYREGSHPCSHIHLGHGTQVRLGTHRIMNPVSFTLFVLRQVYPWQWERYIAMSNAAKNVKHVRAALERVHADYVKTKDTWEIYLE